MQLNFDARAVAPQQALDPIPAGWYTVKIIESEGAPTKDQSGAYLKLVFEVIDGPCAGRKVFDRLNLHNKNQQTVDIAYSQLSAICHATGVIQMSDTSQLHGKPLLAKVTVKQGDGTYAPSNEIKGYKAVGDGGVATGAGVGGNTAGVPSWAGGFQQGQQQGNPAPATNVGAANPSGTTTATSPGPAFGALAGGATPQQNAAQPDPAAQQQQVQQQTQQGTGPAASGLPSWAQKAQ